MTDYRKDFPLLSEIGEHTVDGREWIYIDNAATSQRPQCVIDAERDFYLKHNANPLRGNYPLSVEATELYENARKGVRDFIGAKSAREIIFTRNTTESMNLVAYSYGLTNVKEGDEILVSIMEHHSNLLPWQMVAQEQNCGLSSAARMDLSIWIRCGNRLQKRRRSSQSHRFPMSLGGSIQSKRSRPWRMKKMP